MVILPREETGQDGSLIVFHQPYRIGVVTVQCFRHLVTKFLDQKPSFSVRRKSEAILGVSRLSESPIVKRRRWLAITCGNSTAGQYTWADMP